MRYGSGGNAAPWICGDRRWLFEMMVTRDGRRGDGHWLFQVIVARCERSGDGHWLALEAMVARDEVMVVRCE